ncbi:MAG TPA: flagellar basal body-associated FliL family protein [Candidatus Binatia bacterium]|jgi:flagellar basal body-associated protein FliL
MNKKIIIIAAGAIVGVLGAGAGIYFLKPDLLPGSARSNKPAASKAAKKADTDKKHQTEVGADLDVFVVNLASSGQGRYLRTTLSLGVKNEHEKDKIKEFTGPIRHAVIMYLTERKIEELTAPEGKEKLRHALHEQINEAIGQKMVSSVYFKEFLIQ